MKIKIKGAYSHFVNTQFIRWHVQSIEILRIDFL